MLTPSSSGGVVGFESTCRRFDTWSIVFTSQRLILSGETSSAVGNFYLVSMLGEVNVPMWNTSLTQCVHNIRRKKKENHCGKMLRSTSEDTWNS